MRHIIRYWGWFETSFKGFIDRTGVPLRKDKTEAELYQKQEKYTNVDGVVFSYMQVDEAKGKEQFVAVGANDIRCCSPVCIDWKRHTDGNKGFSMIHSKISDKCANELLLDLTLQNPLLFHDLYKITKEMGWESKWPWSGDRSLFIAQSCATINKD